MKYSTSHWCREREKKGSEKRMKRNKVFPHQTFSLFEWANFHNGCNVCGDGVTCVDASLMRLLNIAGWIEVFKFCELNDEVWQNIFKVMCQ